MKKILLASAIVLLISCLAFSMIAQEEVPGSDVVDIPDGTEFDKDTDLVNMLWSDDFTAGESFEAETIDVGGGASYDQSENGNHIINLDGGKSYLDYEDKDGNKMIVNNFKGDIEIDENGDIVKTTGNVEGGVSELAMNFELKDSAGNEYDVPVKVPEGTNVNYDNGELTLKGDKPFSVCQGNEGLAEGENWVSGKTCGDVDVTPVGVQDVTMGIGDNGRAIDLSCKDGCEVKIGDKYDFETINSEGQITISDAKNEIYDITDGSVFEGGCSEMSCEDGFSVSTQEGSKEPLEVGLKGCDGMSSDNFVCLNPARDQGGFSGKFELENGDFKIDNLGDGVNGEFYATEGGNVIRFDDLSSLGGETTVLTNGKEVILDPRTGNTLLDDTGTGKLASDGSTTILKPNGDGSFDVTKVNSREETTYSTDCLEDDFNFVGAAIVDITGAQTAKCIQENTKVGKKMSDDEIRKMLDQKFKSTPECAKLLKTISTAWPFTPNFIILSKFREQPEAQGYDDATLKRAISIFDKEYRIKGNQQQASVQTDIPINVGQ